MGRHRQAGGARRARSTVVKATAAFGMAAALAVGVKSVADGPVGAQAMSNPDGKPVKDLAAGPVADPTTSAATQQPRHLTPTDMATEPAAAPTPTQLSTAIRTQQVTPSYSAAAQQTASAATMPTVSAPTPSATSSSSRATPAPATSSAAPAPASRSGAQQGTGLLGGVVSGVGGLVNGLLGN
ncbi:hypothetical protein NGB36_14735 [Streptomyces sp. RB6PN25]|uniref:Extensin n=1 Tax=Streptomyces humicola TaxID=2953240 RepID=A0ABT1PVY0_9ACTN|nr:hypothetical protein [Streptomyces humicola]MCQ4081829.1 hypothetical protein [Streptomyces humicola]